MKYMKRIASVVLAMVMVLAMSMPVMAATIKIDGEKAKGHTYDVYQIFTGDLAEDGKTLSNVKYGENYYPTGKNVGDKVPDEDLKAIADAETFAKSFFDGTRSLVGSVKTVKAGGTMEVADGYYLIVDEAGIEDDGYNAYSAYMVRVVGNETLTPKSVLPTVDKFVKDETVDAEEGATDGWGKSADHDLNETFQFKLTASVPNASDYAKYKTYTLVFHDTLSKGVEYKGNVKMTVAGKTITLPDENVVISSEKNESEGTTALTIKITDLKQYVSEYGSVSDIKVEITYDAQLTADAVINEPKSDQTTTNMNKVSLEYSNNPNSDGKGTTAEETVYVFTFTMPNQKTDENGPLEGAGFVLYKENGELRSYVKVDDDNKVAGWTEWVSPDADGKYDYNTAGASVLTSSIGEDGDGKARFDVNGLDAGSYWLEEVITPDGYNTCDPKKVDITAEHEKNNADAEMKFGDGETQKLSTDNVIENKKGIELPETGGIGTTIFYVVGAALVIGAGVLLVVKKRMSKEQ